MARLVLQRAAPVTSHREPKGEGKWEGEGHVADHWPARGDKGGVGVGGGRRRGVHIVSADRRLGGSY